MKKDVLIKKLEDIFGIHRVISERETLYGCAFDATFTSDEVKLPVAVVTPVTTDEVVMLVKLASEYGVPLVPKGAGTNHCGGCACDGGIIINFCKMDKISDFNFEDMSVKAQAGVVLQDLNAYLEQFGLFFPPDPSNLRVSTVGGAVALSSGGSRTFKYGTTKDYVLSLKVVLADGSVVDTGSGLAKDVAGYDLTALLVGSEGTLGVITEATLHLVPKPRASKVFLAYFKTLDCLLQSSLDIIKQGLMPSVIDFMDTNTLKSIAMCVDYDIKTDYCGALLVEFDGDSCVVDDSFTKAVELLKRFDVYIDAPCDKDAYDKLWTARRSAYACSTKLAANVISEDVAVPKLKLLELIVGVGNIVEKHGLGVCILGHIADGNIHPNFLLDLADEAQKRAFLLAKDKMLKLVIELGGTITAEHGIGSDKVDYLPLMFSEQKIKLMKQIKTLFDPKNIFNPGKLLS